MSAAELTVRLRCLDDLFQAPAPQSFQDAGRLVSGIDELLLELDAGRLPKRLRTTILLTAESPPVDESAVRDTLRQYCALRLRELELRLRSHRREELQALAIGSVLFLIGVGLSAEFVQPFWPQEIQYLLGNGVFLVVAWVGAWYPLDHFIFGRRTLIRERKVLRCLLGMEVDVRREAVLGEAVAALE